MSTSGLALTARVAGGPFCQAHFLQCFAQCGDHLLIALQEVGFLFIVSVAVPPDEWYRFIRLRDHFVGRVIQQFQIKSIRQQFARKRAQNDSNSFIRAVQVGNPTEGATDRRLDIRGLGGSCTVDGPPGSSDFPGRPTRQLLRQAEENRALGRGGETGIFPKRPQCHSRRNAIRRGHRGHVLSQHLQDAIHRHQGWIHFL
mmetsp:Transcript_13994/g.23282  ORF Transcript_13994/g.23282 Transcript_13994/m.23282 type:complete len:200 (+) Transcript_13994:537-1136(+)